MTGEWGIRAPTEKALGCPASIPSYPATCSWRNAYSEWLCAGKYCASYSVVSDAVISASWDWMKTFPMLHVACWFIYKKNPYALAGGALPKLRSSLRVESPGLTAALASIRKTSLRYTKPTFNVGKLLESRTQVSVSVHIWSVCISDDSAVSSICSCK